MEISTSNKAKKASLVNYKRDMANLVPEKRCSQDTGYIFQFCISKVGKSPRNICLL